MRLMSFAAIAASVSLFSLTSTFAQLAPVFSESFSGLQDGTALTTSNSDFNYLTADQVNGSMEITGAGTKTPLLFKSHNGGNVTTGFGITGIPSTNVYSVSLNFNIQELTGGTSVYFALGKSGGSLYPTGSARPPRLDNDTNWNAFAAQSEFVIRLGGGGTQAESFGTLSSLTSNGSVASWTNLSGARYLAGETYNIHMVANGGTSAIVIDGNSILAGDVAIFVNSAFVATVGMNDITADTFRVYGHGRSTGSHTAFVEFGEFNIWDQAVSPIPEAGTVASVMAALVLCALVLRRCVHARS